MHSHRVKNVRNCHLLNVILQNHDQEHVTSLSGSPTRGPRDTCCLEYTLSLPILLFSTSLLLFHVLLHHWWFHVLLCHDPSSLVLTYFSKKKSIFPSLRSSLTHEYRSIEYHNQPQPLSKSVRLKYVRVSDNRVVSTPSPLPYPLDTTFHRSTHPSDFFPPSSLLQLLRSQKIHVVCVMDFQMGCREFFQNIRNVSWNFQLTFRMFWGTVKSTLWERKQNA
jgi:hypothetical protein